MGCILWKVGLPILNIQPYPTSDWLACMRPPMQTAKHRAGIHLLSSYVHKKRASLTLSRNRCGMDGVIYFYSRTFTSSGGTSSQTSSPLLSAILVTSQWVVLSVTGPILAPSTAGLSAFCPTNPNGHQPPLFTSHVSSIMDPIRVLWNLGLRPRHKLASSR